MKQYQQADVRFVRLDTEDIMSESAGYIMHDDGSFDAEIDRAY